MNMTSASGTKPIQHDLAGTWEIQVTDKNGNDLIPQAKVKDAKIALKQVK